MVALPRRFFEEMDATREEIRIGVSACLLGENVRYDGGHKRHHWIADVLARHVTLVPFCPEVEAQMGVPREPARLVRGRATIRMIGARSGTDYTRAVRRSVSARVRDLDRLKLDGCILKSNSPSCGLKRVTTYTPAGRPAARARGVFAEALIERMPLLPVEEEGRLNDGALRENFIERVFAHRRLRLLLSNRRRAGSLVEFHRREELLLMAHDPAAPRALGRIVSDTRAGGRRATVDAYREGFMRALEHLATRRRHAGVLRRALGYFKNRMDPADEAEFLEAVESFRTGLVPLIVPLTLLQHHVRRFDVEVLAEQTYLNPHPTELLLRNHP